MSVKLKDLKYVRKSWILEVYLSHRNFGTMYSVILKMAKRAKLTYHIQNGFFFPKKCS